MTNRVSRPSHSRNTVGRQHISAHVRRHVIERDLDICRYCGRHQEALDHVVPVAQGGRGTIDNLVCACWICNAAKHDLTPAEAGMYLFTPSQAYALACVRAELMGETFVELYGPEAANEEALLQAASAFFAAAQARVDYPMLRDRDVAGVFRRLGPAYPLRLAAPDEAIASRTEATAWPK